MHVICVLVCWVYVNICIFLRKKLYFHIHLYYGKIFTMNMLFLEKMYYRIFGIEMIYNWLWFIAIASGFSLVIFFPVTEEIFSWLMYLAWPCPVDMSIIISNSLHLYLESINYSFCNVLYSTMSHYSCLINSGSHTITSRFFMQTIWFCEY